MNKTSIRIKFRRSVKYSEKISLFFRVTRHRTSRSIATDLWVRVEEWDEKSESIILSEETGRQRKKYLSKVRSSLRAMRKSLEQAVQVLEEQSDYTVEQLVKQYKGYNRYRSLNSFALYKIGELKSLGKFGNAHCYQSALNSFLKFRKGQDILLSKLDARLLAEYEKHLRQAGRRPNSISCYMRSLRAIYNYAVDEQIIARPSESPFARAYTHIAPTEKRSVDKSVIRKIQELDLVKNAGLSLSRDLFILSFLLQGMPYVDIIHLRRENIRNGSIRYRRQKTGQVIEIKLLPYMKEIINRYADKQKQSDFLFPILSERLSTEEEWKSYCNGLSRYNRNLKRIASLLHLNTKLTGYVARHSWATQASIKGIPMSTISRGMGHESEKTTRIYIGKLDYSDVNKANQKIVSFLGRPSTAAPEPHSRCLSSNRGI